MNEPNLHRTPWTNFTHTVWRNKKRHKSVTEKFTPFYSIASKSKQGRVKCDDQGCITRRTPTKESKKKILTTIGMVVTIDQGGPLGDFMIFADQVVCSLKKG